MSADSGLFQPGSEEKSHAPLAERMRARTLDDVVGQEALTGPGSPLRRLIEEGRLESMIFWGPPGCGKTTLARILMESLEASHHVLNAVTSGVADLRRVTQQARDDRRFHNRRTVLFIDEIHRFNKAQQDALLNSVEEGLLTLLAATTENPGFEVIPALMSRCHLFTLEALDQLALQSLLNRALKQDEWLRLIRAELEQEAALELMRLSGGDARRLLQLLEICMTVTPACEDGRRILTRDKLSKAGLKDRLLHDKGGDRHYDLISAFIKSIRASDADAAIYWLARMLEGGEEPRFIARRLLIVASEDIGNAAPNGLVLANACFEAVHNLGMPEAMYPLAQCTAYLASQPKSNRSASAILAARDLARKTGELPVPFHLRNAPTGLAKKLGHGAEYQYPPSHEGSFAGQDCRPEDLKETVLYHPSNRGLEGKLREYLTACWPRRERKS